ncbi:MAG: FG-GAP repeat protein, partial [Gammaproteobacteria bacterium]|nr:FG-GAP repeat protein [Gammaproteobacteria bacterium]
SAMGEASAATGVNNTDPGEGDNSLEGAGSVGAGAVYVFRYNEMSGWTQQAYIKASNTDAKDRFGWSIALSEDGNILAVGTFNEGSSLTGAHNSPPWPDDNDAPSSGAVYMFRYSEITGWEQEAYIKASNAQAGDYFGEKLALSADGNTLAVGAWGEDGYGTGINNTDPGQFNDVGSFPDNGAVYVFRYDEIIGWEQQAYIKSSHIFQRDSFGESIALSADGNVLAVGTTRENSVGRGVYTSEPEELDDTHYTSGAVYVFRYTAMTGWVQEAYIKSSNSDIGDGFGRPIALSADGKTLAVSAYNENSGARGTSGTDAEQEDNSVSNSGAVYVFRYIESTGWTQQAYIKASNSDSLDNFGFRIALSADGNTLAVAALWEDSAATGLNGSETEQEDNSANNSGAVYLFRYSEAAAWVQQTYVKAPNTDAEDYFGRSIALSGDGSTLAVGANREDGLDDGTTDDAGVVYLY